MYAPAVNSQHDERSRRLPHPMSTPANDVHARKRCPRPQTMSTPANDVHARKRCPRPQTMSTPANDVHARKQGVASCAFAQQTRSSPDLPHAVARRPLSKSYQHPSRISTQVVSAPKSCQTLSPSRIAPSNDAYLRGHKHVAPKSCVCR